MKVEVVSGTLGPFQVDMTHKDWYLHSMYIFTTLIQRDFRDLQGVKNLAMS